MPLWMKGVLGKWVAMLVGIEFLRAVCVFLKLFECTQVVRHPCCTAGRKQFTGFMYS